VKPLSSNGRAERVQNGNRRNDKMRNIKLFGKSIPRWVLVLALIVVVTTVNLAIASTTWTHTYTWVVAQASSDIKVYACDGTTKGSEIVAGKTETLPGTTVYYWIENVGNGKIQVFLGQTLLHDGVQAPFDLNAVWTVNGVTNGFPTTIDVGQHAIVSFSMPVGQVLPAGAYSYIFSFNSQPS
jgi:hypothetical protein